MRRYGTCQDIAAREELQRLERAAVRAQEALAALHETVLVPHLSSDN